MSRQEFARILVFCIVASALTPSADAQTTGIREVSASPRSLIPLQTRLRLHDDDRSAGGRGDP